MMEIPSVLTERSPMAESGISSSMSPLLIFLTALIVRIVALVVIGSSENPQLWEFGPIAENLASGHGYSRTFVKHDATQILPTAYMPPAYPMILALFLFALGDRTTTYLLISIVQCVAGALASVLLYKVTSSLLDGRSGRVAGVMCALYPPLIYASIDFGPTTFYTLCLGILWWLAVVSVGQKTYFHVGSAGLAGGCLSLLRGEGAIVALTAAIWYILQGSRKRAVIFLTGVVVVILPWLVRNYFEFNQFVPITTAVGLNFWRGHNDAATGTGRNERGEGIWVSQEIASRLNQIPLSPSYEVERDRIYLSEALDFIRANPTKEISLSLKKLFLFWTVDITHPKAQSVLYVVSWGIVFFLFFLGLSFALVRHEKIGLFLLFYLSMTLIVTAFFVLPRYQIILSYGVLPLSAYGAIRAYDWFKAVKSKENLQFFDLRTLYKKVKPEIDKRPR